MEFELGPFQTPLQRLRDEHQGRDDTAVAILEAAARLAADGTGAPAALVRERERFRRMEIDPALIEDLAARSAQVGEESYDEAYALLELLQAAAVGNCALAARNVCSIRLAVAAKQQQRIGPARAAYTDVFAGIEILGRLFESMSGDIGHARESAREGWAAVKASSPGGLDVFDPEGDPAEAWERILIWHTDVGSGHGLLSQADATLRLALHFEHWVERRGGSLDESVPALIEQCALAKDQTDEQSNSGHSLLAGRLLLTVGDALLEVGQWRLAVIAFNRAAAAWPETRHPVYFRATAQEASAWLRLGDLAASRQALDRIDVTQLEGMAQLVVTVAAEAARYRALEALWTRRAGRQPSNDAQRQINDHLRTAGLIGTSDPANRLEYLRTLYFVLTARGVERMTDEALRD